jgi:hypothetical protein
MSSRTKRRSSAECALPPELGCPSSPQFCGTRPIHLTRSPSAKSALTGVKKETFELLRPVILRPKVAPLSP